MPEPLTGLTEKLHRVGVATDHGGFELKKQLVGGLRAAGHEVVDFGDGRVDPDDDYPDFVVPLAREVARGEVDRGVAICGSGVGACVIANKVAGVRAGWALGDGQEHGDDPAWDAAETEAFYDLLEREVIPEFYTRDESCIPTAWVKRMRESMARLTPRFSANRSVREYTEQHYLPAATACHLRMANKGAVGRQMVDWRHSLEQKWATLHFGESKVETRGGQHIFTVEVYLNDLDPNAVRVELYADGIKGGTPVRQEMKRVRQSVGAPGGTIYSAAVSAASPPADYTARVIPHCDGVAIPLEDSRILWQR